MGSLPKVGIVIPAFNEEELLPKTLFSLFSALSSLSDYQFDVVVVDNNSTDKTADIALDLGAKVVFEPINQISKARNTGARSLPKAKYLFFLDADTTVNPQVIQEALLALESEKFCGGGALVKFPKESFFVSFWTLITKTFKVAAGAFIFCTNEGFIGSGGYSEKIYAAEDVLFSRSLKAWARKNNKGKFTILTNNPIITSDRKFKWYSGGQILWQLLLLGLMPWRLRKRKNAMFWYTRPQARPKDNDE
ncbi:MAG: glycosyltransferase [Lentisphaeraceae bacterium]|nr:glycosyltransferase [Lentisphaeraceae bacterium]